MDGDELYEHNTYTPESARLVSWLLLLAKVEGKEGNTGNLDDLEAATGDITLRFTSLTETRNENLVVFVDEVQATVSRDEAGNLLTVLDELNANTLTNGRVRLLSLKTATRKQRNNREQWSVSIVENDKPLCLEKRQKAGNRVILTSSRRRYPWPCRNHREGWPSCG